MSDLHDLLTEAVSAQAPATPPPLDTLVRRVRRRRQFGIATAVAATAVAVVVPVAVIGSTGSHDTGPVHPTKHSPIPTTAPPKPISYPLCRSSDVFISATPSVGEPLLGIRNSVVQIRNGSPRPCTLAGRPRMTFSDAARDHLTIQYANGVDGERSPAHPHAIVLGPADYADVYIQTLIHSVPQYPNCGNTDNPIWSITLHAGQQPIPLGHHDLPACLGTDVTVTPFVPAGPALGRISLTNAVREAPFAVYVPTTNPHVLDSPTPQDVRGDAILTLEYRLTIPASAEGSKADAQVEVYEHPALPSTPAMINTRRNSPRFQACSVGSRAASCVPAGRPEPHGGHTTADVFFDLDGTTVELHGGTSLQPLLQIAENLVPVIWPIDPGFIYEGVGTHSSNGLGFDSSVAHIRWTLHPSCSVSYQQLSPLPKGGGGSGAAGCPFDKHISIGATGSFGSAGGSVSVLGGRINGPDTDRVEVALANGQTSVIFPQDGYWLATVQRCGDYTGTAFTMVTLLDSHYHVIATKQVNDRTPVGGQDPTAICYSAIR